MPGIETQCSLANHGPCDTGVTGEHYILQSLLHRSSADKMITISGAAWTGGMEKTFGKAALVANIFCFKHHSALSALDMKAGRLFEKILEAELELQAGPKQNRTFIFAGHRLERWL